MRLKVVEKQPFLTTNLPGSFSSYNAFLINFAALQNTL